MLSKDHPEISEFELMTILGRKKATRQEKGIAIFELGDMEKSPDRLSDFRRLAYTNSAYELLFAAERDDLIAKMKDFDWQKHYQTNFCLKVTNLTEISTEHQIPFLADIIWKKLRDPKADLRNPKTVFEIIFADRVYVCKLIWRNSKDYNQRKPHMRPMLYPISLSPKLARACVNMTGIKKGIILDPFCGTGGFLIEAALMGFATDGSDMDPIMIRRTRANLEYYNCKRFRLRADDALTLSKAYDFIVTDLPYGRNTKNIEYRALYSGFLKALEKMLKRRAVIIFPDFCDYKKMVSKTRKLRIVKEFDYYIHKSMTKKIVVIDKNHAT
jgi:tRNA (guanine10-N2)-dimethyltransferase